MFAIHGLPEQVFSDNGSGLTSTEFQQFLSDNGVKQTFTSPYHPSSNGLAERAVQTFKSTVTKLDGSMDISKVLFRYRVTSQTTTCLSPGQLLMGRRLRTHLDLLHPVTSQKAVDKQQRTTVDKRPRRFSVGDKLLARNFSPGPKWIPVVVSQISGYVSYYVAADDVALSDVMLTTY